MAARTGFEPVNAALRGLWLQPLAERAMCSESIAQSKAGRKTFFLSSFDAAIRVSPDRENACPQVRTGVMRHI